MILKQSLSKYKYAALRLFRDKKKHSYIFPLKLHLGCGYTYLQGWVNIDISANSVADVVCDFKYLNKLYINNSVSVIKIIHSISYLRLWETRDFFKMCFDLLKKDGCLILEFPDIVKCAKIIIENDGLDTIQYIEGIRGFYAFDLDEIEKKKKYIPYAFGWSANHIEQELIKIGFSNIKISDGNEHYREWRDTRVEATK